MASWHLFYDLFLGSALLPVKSEIQTRFGRASCEIKDHCFPDPPPKMEEQNLWIINLFIYREFYKLI